MPQSGKQDPNDRFDARNPGVPPYKGSTDSELEREERKRRRTQRQAMGGSVEGEASPSPGPDIQQPVGVTYNADHPAEESAMDRSNAAFLYGGDVKTAEMQRLADQRGISGGKSPAGSRVPRPKWRQHMLRKR